MNNSDNAVSVNLGTIMNKVYDYLTYLIFNPQVIMILVIGIVLYIVMFVFLGERSVQQTSFTSSPSSGSSILTNMVIMFLIIKKFQLQPCRIILIFMNLMEIR